MPKFKDLRIGLRLGAGFTALIAIGLAIAAYAELTLAGVESELDLLTHDRIPKLETLVAVKDNVNVIARAVRNIALADDAQRRNEESARIDKARAENTKHMQALETTITTVKGKALLHAAAEARTPYAASIAKAVETAAAGRAAESGALLFGDVRKAQTAYLGALEALIAYQRELMKQADRTVEAHVKQAERVMLGLAALGTALGAALGWLVTRSITRPLGAAVRLAETVATGDLRSRVASHSKDETGQLLAALGRMNESLVRIVGTVRGNAEGVSAASAQIATGNADLSQRTEEQAGNLQQTAASTEQLATTVAQNADTARQAAQLAAGASAVAAQGGEVVARVVSTMGEISESSRRIAEIIGTIDGIAFQTNILALNAAVEAARAGEQGRGFAVVAGEVRTLAQRSANAAREIKSLIVTSAEKVEAGSTLVESAGATMGEIVAHVKRVNDLLGEISAASTEQSKGIGEVRDAVGTLDQVTQQNAALVEESAAAAESLKQQAAQLAQTVAVFRIPADESNTAAA